MRTLQLLGFLLGVAGILLGYIMLSPVDGSTSEASAAGAGIGLMFMVLPMLAWSAFMLLPSSFALFNQKIRQRAYFTGHFWLNLWRLNLAISAVYIAALLYFAYLWFNVSAGH